MPLEAVQVKQEVASQGTCQEPCPDPLEVEDIRMEEAAQDHLLIDLLWLTHHRVCLWGLESRVIVTPGYLGQFARQQ